MSGGGPRDAGLGGKTRYDHQVKGKFERYRRRSVRKNSSVVVDQRVSEPMQVRKPNHQQTAGY